jgi:hypothetical protein
VKTLKSPETDPTPPTVESDLNVMPGVVADVKVQLSPPKLTPIEPMIGSAFAAGVIARAVAIASKANANFFMIPP